MTGAKNYQVADLGKDGSMLMFDLPAGAGKSYKVGVKYDRASDTYGLNIRNNTKNKASIYSVENGLDALELTREIRRKTGVAMSLQG
jgi:hypothetical protein